jgi:SseB protein N-terminal domain
MSGIADSAGVPWAGRTLTSQPFAGDDGSANPELAAALAGGNEHAVARALALARVLVPVVAVLGEERAPVGPSGLPSDKSADMAVATLVGRNGRKALPVFSSLATLAAWDSAARPVPAEGTRAALSAVADGCDALVLDPAGPRSCVVRRPVLWALAQGRSWLPPAQDPDVLRAVEHALAGVGVDVAPGPGLQGDLRLRLGVPAGLDAGQLSALLADVQARLAASEVLAERAEGLELEVAEKG